MAQAQPKKILIIGPSWVGDMVMAQSLFIAIKQDNPNVQIDVLAMDWTRALLQRMPEVHKAIIMPITHGVFGWKQRKAIGRSLRTENYDQAIVLPNSWKSALIPWFANIPIRTGWRGEMRYGLLNDIRKLDKATLPLMVQRYVSLAYTAEQSRYAPSYPAPKMVAEPITHNNFPSLAPQQKRLILCPGAEFGPAKQWPTASYAEVAKSMIQKGWQVLILGSKADQATGTEIHQYLSTSEQPQCHNLTGQTSLEEAIDILATADYVVSNDSGLMHLTAALQRPLIAIYGPTSPDFTPPLANNSRILQQDMECGPCFQRTCPEGHHECMKQVNATEVSQLIQADYGQ
jgi:heptosyltransferase-2